jgi:NAD(P)-dependent dehydrogenase (short-subunit alcohol dehydrogenase family)
MKRTIFITGSSSGLGKAAAILFAQKEWRVIATMRNPKNEKELIKFPDVHLLSLDVTDLKQIKSTVKEAIKKSDIDVVFNNAGYGLAGPFEGTTDEQIQKEINTNLLGVMRVTREFIPYFRERKKGLFITTTSIGGLSTFPFNSVYHATKWALEGWSESMHYELSKFGIGIKTVAPGGISTDFAGRSLVVAAHPSYKKMTDRVYEVFMSPERQKSNSTPQQIAEIVYQAATDGKKKLRYIAGKDARTLYFLRRLFGYKFIMKLIDRAFFKNLKF